MARSEHVRFTFDTGVSKFSIVNPYSGPNNLIDLTNEPECSEICRYTEDDLNAVFGPELEELDREKFRDSYNGHNWLGEERVDNPLDILLQIRPQEFNPYGFETGTPEFLVRTLFKRRVPSMRTEHMTGDHLPLSSFGVEDIAIEALLFQAGCLTFLSNDIGRYAEFYASVFYSYFASLEMNVAVEEGTRLCRVDMVVHFDSNVYLFEFKVVEVASLGAAMAHLKGRHYALQFKGSGQPI